MVLHLEFTDGTHEDVTAEDWRLNSDSSVLTIVINTVTREYEYLPTVNLKRWSTER
jgi:hypothetical protein